MLKIFFSRSSKLEKLLFDYLDSHKSSQDCFHAGMKEWISPDCKPENFDFHVGQTHKHESRADDIRDDINNTMYGKVLIPESRSDIMGLIGNLDSMLHTFETVNATIQIQKLDAPAFARDDLSEIVDVSMESCNCLRVQTEELFRGETGIRKQLALIDDYESKCDHIDRRIMTQLFESDLDPFFKLQFKELMGQISKISDQAELVARRVNILSLKRRV